MSEISVLMGTYNENKKQTAQAIDSIINQTFQDLEFIICDDGSEQLFFEWLKRYCKKDSRILLLRNEKNLGLAVTLNRCLKYASGTYIARMDADDLSKPKRLEKQAAFLGQHPEYALIGCNAQLIDMHGVWGERRLKKIPEKRDFLNTSPFIHPTIMIRREVIEELHGYCELPQVFRTEDYEFFMRLYAKGYVGYNLQKMLFQYREGPKAYAKRKYRYRINECRVRCHGFAVLGILKGNWWYVIKPLIIGLVPKWMIRLLRTKRFQKKGLR